MLRKLLAPSLPDILFAVLLLSLVVRPQALEQLLRDGDTGWHIRTGEMVLQTHHVPHADPFSFTRPNQPWMAWEWGAGVLFAEAFRLRGLAGVACLAAVVLSLAAAAMFAFLLRRGHGLWIGLVATLAAVSASSIHFLARPHVFSILFYTVSTGILGLDRRRRGPLLWTLVPMTAVWANLHAGFVAWPATLLLLLVHCGTRGETDALRRYGTLAALCSAATLATPYGWRLHQHILGYLHSSWIMDHVQEFQSPQIRSEGAVVFALLLIATLVQALRGDRFEAILAMAWGFLALRSARHVPFFAVSAAPVLAAGLSELWNARVARAGRGSAVEVFQQLGRELGTRMRVSAWLPASAAIVLAAAPAAGFSNATFPVAAVQANLELLAVRAPIPRILTSDQWADYLIFRLYPSQRVFFDGRSDFFGAELGAEYRSLSGAEGNWRELLERYGFGAALLPREWALASVLEREPGWSEVYRDALAVLFVRDTPIVGQDSPCGRLGAVRIECRKAMEAVP